MPRVAFSCPHCGSVGHADKRPPGPARSLQGMSGQGPAHNVPGVGTCAATRGIGAGCFRTSVNAADLSGLLRALSRRGRICIECGYGTRFASSRRVAEVESPEVRDKPSEWSRYAGFFGALTEWSAAVASVVVGMLAVRALPSDEYLRIPRDLVQSPGWNAREIHMAVARIGVLIAVGLAALDSVCVLLYGAGNVLRAAGRVAVWVASLLIWWTGAPGDWAARRLAPSRRPWESAGGGPGVGRRRDLDDGLVGDPAGPDGGGGGDGAPARDAPVWDLPEHRIRPAGLGGGGFCRRDHDFVC